MFSIIFIVILGFLGPKIKAWAEKNGLDRPWTGLGAVERELAELGECGAGAKWGAWTQVESVRWVKL